MVCIEDKITMCAKNTQFIFKELIICVYNTGWRIKDMNNTTNIIKYTNQHLSCWTMIGQFIADG